MHFGNGDGGVLPKTSEAALPIAGLATVAFVGITAGVQMSDRGLQSILSPAIKEAFGVGDAVIGALHGIAGILVASAVAVPLARLADRYSRKLILLSLIAGWAALTALGALAPNFPVFFLGRAASGVTEFAMIPIVYSLIPDLVGERWRVSSNLAFAALMAIGASLGFYLGGDLLAFADGFSYSTGMEGWRVAMLILSAAGLPLLLLGLLTRDPPRSASDDEEAAIVSLAAFLRSQAQPILLFIGAAGGLAIAVQATVPMLAMGLSRQFSSELGSIGHALGIITLITSLGALPIAGALDRGLRERLDARARPAIMGAGAALAIPCMLLLGWASSQAVALASVAFFLLTTCIANALIPTIIQDIVPSPLRARCFAMYSFLIAAFCALGPVLSGSVSDLFAKGALLYAIAVVGVPSLLIAVLCALGSFRIRSR